MNNIVKIKSEHLDDFYYKVKHPSGLTIYIYPKKKNNSTYAVFGTKYGSIDNCFKISGEKEPHKVPDGIAHYLEHKLFESEDGDAFARYAKTGASANAYTSFYNTCYLFSCTQNVYESLEILLDFVQSPYFTIETVQKEQGIIGQEIKMYDDDPQWCVLFDLLEAMYHNHPVKNDIAGTVASIAKITPELLYECYNTFYNLNNMVLCIAGNIDAEKVLRLCDKMLKPSKPIEIERIFEKEPQHIVKARVEKKLAVASPLFNLGFKEEANGPMADVGKLAQTDILLEAFAGDFTKLYRRLLDKGLINENSFGKEYFEGPGFASIIFGGDSKDPEAAAEEIRKAVAGIRRNGVNPTDFERAKKSLYGRNVASLNDVGNIANSLATLSLSGRDFFGYIDAVADAKIEDVNARLETQLKPEYSSLSVIRPFK